MAHFVTSRGDVGAIRTLSRDGTWRNVLGDPTRSEHLVDDEINLSYCWTLHRFVLLHVPSTQTLCYSA